jgi:hypothetical protein
MDVVIIVLIVFMLSFNGIMSNLGENKTSNNDDDCTKTLCLDDMETIDKRSYSNSVKVPHRLRYSQIKRIVNFQKNTNLFFELEKKFL